MSERGSGAGMPALVASMCAVATVLMLGAVLYMADDVAAVKSQSLAQETRIAGLEAVRSLMIDKVDELQRRLDEMASSPPPSPVPTGSKNTGGGWASAASAKDAPDLETPSLTSDSATAPVPLPAVDDSPDALGDGRVLVAASLRGTILVDKGRRDGWQRHDALLIMRQGQIVGEAQVTQAPFADMALARVITADEIRIGDRVRRDAPEAAP